MRIEVHEGREERAGKIAASPKSRRNPSTESGGGKTNKQLAYFGTRAKQRRYAHLKGK